KYKIYSLNYEFDGNDGKPEKFEDILMTDNSFEDDEINKIFVQDLLNRLDKKELEIVRLYYFEDMNQREIAEIYNTSQFQISRTLRMAINKFKKATKNPNQSILSSTTGTLSKISV
ncbi:sigma-70 family RNA polymerase sigma factor, partial [Clostridium neonatale]